MTSVNMPRDDAAIRIDPKAPRTRNVNPLEPYPAAHPVQPHEEATTAPEHPKRKPQQRRQGDRRKKDDPVLLDTRSGGDRRKGAPQENASENGQADTPAKHIDVYT
jgi:hypothetical protein